MGDHTKEASTWGGCREQSKFPKGKGKDHEGLRKAENYLIAGIVDEGEGVPGGRIDRLDVLSKEGEGKVKGIEHLKSIQRKESSCGTIGEPGRALSDSSFARN